MKASTAADDVERLHLGVVDYTLGIIALMSRSETRTASALPRSIHPSSSRYRPA